MRRAGFDKRKLEDKLNQLLAGGIDIPPPAYVPLVDGVQLLGGKCAALDTKVTTSAVVQSGRTGNSQLVCKSASPLGEDVRQLQTSVSALMEDVSQMRESFRQFCRHGLGVIPPGKCGGKDGESRCAITERQTMYGAMDRSLEPVNERMSLEPANERISFVKRQQSSWAERAVDRSLKPVNERISPEPVIERMSLGPGSEMKDVKIQVSSSAERAVDQSLKPVNERMSPEPVKERKSFEPVSERKKIEGQEGSWTEGANLTDTFFLKSRIHTLNTMVNKVCGEIRRVRTKADIQEEVEKLPVEDQEETEIHLNSIRLQQFCQVVLGVLHPDHHKEKYLDDSVCERQRVHPYAGYVHLKEQKVKGTLEGPGGPDSSELLHATSLVCRALHNIMDMSERKRAGVEDTDESAEVVEFARDSNLFSRVRVFDKLVRKSLQTENMERSATRKKL